MPLRSQMTWRDAQVVSQRCLDLAASQFRIARLHRTEQAFFGGQQHARAVDVDAAAFQHQARLPCAQLQARGQLAGIAASFIQSSYLAQALKRQLVSATSPARFFTNSGQ